MSSELDPILAAPDDDAPRLVWADQVGGERGELVVVQCALARSDLPRVDRKRLVTREAELLQRAWTFSDLPASVRGTWVRGFVEVISLEVRDQAVSERLFEFAPLCRAVELRDSESINSFIGPRADEAWAGLRDQLARAFARLPPGRLTGLSWSASIQESGDWNDPGITHRFGDEFLALVAATPALSALRELRVYDGDLTIAAAPHLATLPSLHTLVGKMKVTGAEAVSLLTRFPNLVHFAPWSSGLSGPHLETLLASGVAARLVELDLNGNGLGPTDVQRLGSCDALGALRRLGLGYASTRHVAPLADGQALRSLEGLALSGVPVVDLSTLGRAPFAPSLRTLIASSATVTARDALTLARLPRLEHLAVEVGDRSVRDALGAIPRLVT